MPSNQEMTIPKERSEAIILFPIYTVVIFSTLLAIVNLCNGIALVASPLWLALVTMMIWTACKDEGGLRRFLINRMGDLFGRCFVESGPTNAQPKDIRFGFQLLGHRFIQQRIPLDRIESVEWKTGQASDMAGRDMDDWHVCVWFDHYDPKKSEKQRRYRKPDQDIYCVGPSRRKDLTETLGQSLVALLRDAGADLSQGATTACFVRRKHGEAAVGELINPPVEKS